MSFNTKKFIKLKAFWDKKLKASGFEDIENSDGTLKAATDTRTIRQALIDKEERETYYSIAREFMTKHKFSSKLEQDIWEAHCEGRGRQAVAKELGITFYRVNKIITTLQKLAKLRKQK